jgi:hypothetical protein
MNLTTTIVQVFEPAMCCSTGVCGPSVDSRLVQFAGDIEWLKTQGVIVQRHNLAQSPGAFVENEPVRQALSDQGESALPIILVNGKLSLSGRYPERGELARITGVKAGETGIAPPSNCCRGGAC